MPKGSTSRPYNRKEKKALHSRGLQAVLNGKKKVLANEKRKDMLRKTRSAGDKMLSSSMRMMQRAKKRK